MANKKYVARLDKQHEHLLQKLQLKLKIDDKHHGVDAMALRFALFYRAHRLDTEYPDELIVYWHAMLQGKYTSTPSTKRRKWDENI